MKNLLMKRWDVGAAGVLVAMMVFACATRVCAAQEAEHVTTAASYTQAYCSGFVAESTVPNVGQVLGAEEGDKKNDLVVGDLIYLGEGPVSNAREGEEFSVIRPLRTIGKIGTLYGDIAHVKIVDLNGTVVTAKITFSCEPLNVGDWVVVPQSRFLPPSRPSAPVNRLAHASGKTEGEIVASKAEAVQLGQGQIIYLNIGAAKGVQPGAILRIFRPSSVGSINEYNRGQVKKYVDMKDFPRQVLGECVVLQVGPDTAVALITASVEELAVGDHVEVE